MSLSAFGRKTALCQHALCAIYALLQIGDLLGVTVHLPLIFTYLDRSSFYLSVKCPKAIKVNACI